MKSEKYIKIQTIVLILLRLVIGYHFLYEGIDKLLSPNWTSAGFLAQANWLFSDMFHFIADSPSLLTVVDFINIWGQILVGLGLILGLFSTCAAWVGTLLIFLYYVAIPPFVDGPSFIDKNLFELFALLVLAVFPSSRIIGIDLLIHATKKQKS